MRADLLHVVTAVFNPIRWGSRLKLYHAFRQHMLDSGVKLTVVECAFGERPFELEDSDPRVTHVGVRATTLAWNKENLVNIGFANLPADARYIAWIDADVEFRNKNWAAETVHALQQYAVVQPWSKGLDLGPDGEPMLIKGTHVQTSFAKVWHELGSIDDWSRQPLGSGIPDYSYPHPGYAWAARRDVLDRLGGLVEASGLGAGDHQMAMGFIGKIEGAIHGQTHHAYKDMIRAWAHRAHAVVGGRISAVRGTIEHAFHGEKDKRKYQERWETLVKHGFNPVTDLRRNLDGVIELAGNKPAMEQDFDRYFRQRDEDANIRAG